MRYYFQRTRGIISEAGENRDSVLLTTFSKRNRGSSSVCVRLEEAEHHLLMSSVHSRRHMSLLQGDCQPSLLQWCIITEEKTKPSLTKLYPLNISSAFGFGALASFEESEASPFLSLSPCMLSSPGFPQQPSGIKSPKGRRLHTQFSHISSASQR